MAYESLPLEEDEQQQQQQQLQIQSPATTSSQGNNNNNPFPDPSSGLPFFNLPLNMQNVQLPVEGWAVNPASRPQPF